MFIYSVSAEYSGKIVADTLDGADTGSEDDLDAISSGGYDIARNVELDNVPEKDNETLNTQHREDDVHAAKRGFDLNKLPWFGGDLSDPLSRHCSGFLTEFFWPAVTEKLLQNKIIWQPPPNPSQELLQNRSIR
ncbi:hypothetical protein AHAS_Ahas14G0112200 [Arachis hypogaea]